MRSFSSDEYVVTGTPAWNGTFTECVVTAWEDETASAFTFRDTYAMLPSGQVEINPPAGTPITEATYYASWPYPRTMRLVYQDEVSLSSAGSSS